MYFFFVLFTRVFRLQMRLFFFPFLSLKAACSSGEWLALSVSCQVNSFGEGLQENTGNCGKLFFSVGTYHLQIRGENTLP